MPITFDFGNSGTAVYHVSTSNPGPVINIADGVTFTLSTDASGGQEEIIFGNDGSPNYDLYLTDGSTTNDVWTLTFVSTANTINNILSGTASNELTLQFGSVFGSMKLELLNATGAVFDSTTITTAQSNGSLNFGSVAISGIKFTSLSLFVDAMNLKSMSGNALNCFCVDTKISTPNGPVSIQNLEFGDVVTTAAGGSSTVNWLGVQEVDVRTTDPKKVNPICISAGALGENTPARDLFVS